MFFSQLFIAVSHVLCLCLSPKCQILSWSYSELEILKMQFPTSFCSQSLLEKIIRRGIYFKKYIRRIMLFKNPSKYCGEGRLTLGHPILLTPNFLVKSFFSFSTARSNLIAIGVNVALVTCSAFCPHAWCCPEGWCWSSSLCHTVGQAQLNEAQLLSFSQFSSQQNYKNSEDSILVA